MTLRDHKLLAIQNDNWSLSEVEETLGKRHFVLCCKFRKFSAQCPEELNSSACQYTPNGFNGNALCKAGIKQEVKLSARLLLLKFAGRFTWGFFIRYRKGWNWVLGREAGKWLYPPLIKRINDKGLYR